MICKKKYHFSLFWIILAFNILFIYGQDKNKLEIKKNEILKEIELTTKLIEETKIKSKNSLNELSLIEYKITSRNKLISTIEDELSNIENQINANINGINQINKQEEKLKENYAKSIYTTYKNKSKNFLLLYIIASETINKAYKRFRYIQVINKYRRKQIVLLTDLKRIKEKENNKLEKILNKKKELIKEYENEKSNLQEEKLNKSVLLKKLQEKEKELKIELENKQKIAKQLDNEIQKIIKEERNKNIKAKGIETLTAEEKIISNEFEKNFGRLPWPTKQGIIIGKFGEQEHPYLKGIKVRNDGIYIATVKNAEVRCVFKGVITKIFTVPGSNYSVLIKHGNYYTLYHNLTEIKITVGKAINTKETIGYVATDAEKNESILYFQVWKETEKQDPELWLAK